MECARLDDLVPYSYAASVKKSLNKYLFIQESGKDSQDKKRNHMKGLLVAATDCEPQYITRLLQVIFGMFSQCTSHGVYSVSS
jgi:hypothetical protein